MNLKKLLVVVAITAVILAGCGDGKPASNAGKTSSAGDAEIAEIAKEAYIFGLPLVLIDLTRRLKINTGLLEVNQIDFFDKFPDTSFRDVVRPNVDTYYSFAHLDLTVGPVKLSLPPTSGRYHMIEVVDAYTNVFAVPGTRTTGNDGGDFIFTGPGWTGGVPEGMTEYKSSTNYVWVIGRTQVNSEEDGRDFVVPLIRQYKLEPLNKDAPLAEQCDPTVPQGDPNAVVAAMPIDDFFNYLNCLMVINPPAEADREILERMAKIGVAPGAKFDLAKFDAGVQSAIKDAKKKAMNEVIAHIKVLPRENGWISLAIDAVGNFGTDYLLRAHIAHIGLGANLAIDAVYLIAKTDVTGALLNGSNKYVIRFEPESTPPVNAFWSLTVYDEDSYLIANPINRFALGDRDALKKNADGSIDIYIQHTNPGGEKESNWLPTPAGIFDLTLRAYHPKPELASGSWKMPEVKIVEQKEIQ
jgi:DNA sulfur modification protein DndE